MQRSETCRVGFDLTNLSCFDAPQSRHAVLGGRTFERVEPAELGLIERNNELPAFHIVDVVLGTELPKKPHAAPAQLSFQTPWLVVDAGMDDTRVVARLMRGERGFLLEDDHLAPGIAAGELTGDRKPNDPSTHDPNRKLLHEEGTYWLTLSTPSPARTRLLGTLAVTVDDSMELASMGLHAFPPPLFSRRPCTTMKITEKDRLDLRRELERVFTNPRFAEIAMEAMPPIDYDKLATKDDLLATRHLLESDTKAFRTEMTSEFVAVRAEMATEFAAVRGEMASEFAAVRTEMATEFAAVRTEIATMNADIQGKFVSHMRLTFFMQLATFTAIISYLNAAL